MSARIAHFEVAGNFGGGKHRAHVTVTELDTGAMLFAVRPFHSREEYTLPLGNVAEIVMAKVVKNDLANAGLRVPGPRRA